MHDHEPINNRWHGRTNSKMQAQVGNRNSTAPRSMEEPASAMSSIIIFSKPLVQTTETLAIRLPPNFVGVRNVRPPLATKIKSCDRSKQQHQKSQSEYTQHFTTVKFVVTGQNGQERRMTASEKRTAKRRMAQEKRDEVQDAKKKPKMDEIDEDDDVNDDPDQSEVNEPVASVLLLPPPSLSLPGNGSAQSSYHQLPVSSKCLEEELAESKAMRTKAGMQPPVVLSPPMSWQAFQAVPAVQEVLVGGEMSLSSSLNSTLRYDHALSQQWAGQLFQDSIHIAEDIRSREDMRPLAYRLHPEPWQRMRAMKNNATLLEDLQTPLATSTRPWRGMTPVDGKCETKEEHPVQPTDIGAAISTMTLHINPPMFPLPKSRDWTFMTCRPSMVSSHSPRHDAILSVVFEYIYKETPYFVSCGAKFGSDFLIYDGPRNERHAFAGLKVLSDATTLTSISTVLDKTNSYEGLQFPIPTAYSLTSFVRCLNTAGKLALLATVVFDVDNETDDDERHYNDNYRVLIVDVALEKVLDAPTHKRRQYHHNVIPEQRKDMTKNLGKRRNM